MSEVERLREEVKRLHDEIEHVDELVTGGRTPANGLILRQDRNERQIEENAKQIREVTELVRANAEGAKAIQDVADERCEARASDLHKRVDGERDARSNEIRHAAAPLEAKLVEVQKDAAQAKLWIRVAVWVVAPIYGGLVALLFWLVREVLGSVPGI